MHGFAHSQRSDESVLLLDEVGHTSEGSSRWTAAVDECFAFNLGSRPDVTVGEDVEKSGLSAAARTHQSTYFSFEV